MLNLLNAAQESLFEGFNLHRLFALIVPMKVSSLAFSGSHNYNSGTPFVENCAKCPDLLQTLET
jgi:hypothetical protein